MSDMFRSTVGRCLRETIIGFHVIRKPGVTSLESVAYLDLLKGRARLRFTPDGNVLLSPVGNRISGVDLVQDS